MTAPKAVGEKAFGEVTAEPRVTATPMSHVSVEVGHLYMEDYEAGADALRRRFAQVTPWLAAASSSASTSLGVTRPRVSTCFLIDDYFSRFSTPAEIVPMLLQAAAESGITIDYLARESACAETNGISLAQLVKDHIVIDPAPGTNGIRPPFQESGWLSNGQRSPGGYSEAMDVTAGWRPPQQNAARRHSVFVDVELWDDIGDERVWSCPFLATVWQLQRLGLLRYLGRPVAQPVPYEGDLPNSWEELPAITRLNPAAQPFNAYRTVSAMSVRFLPIEVAVRTILGQVAVDGVVHDMVLRRAEDEHLRLTPEIVDRISYVFLTELHG